jgi:hypothetical protein
MTLRTRDKQSKDTRELPRWIRDLNPGLGTENWRVLHAQSEPKVQWLVLLMDRDFANAIKETSYKVFIKRNPFMTASLFGCFLYFNSWTNDLLLYYHGQYQPAV